MKVTAVLTDSYQVKAMASGHEYWIDQPEEKGGKGTGASPGAVLAAAVAGCKAMVAKGYLDARNISYDRVDTTVDYEFKGPSTKAVLEMTIYVDVIGASVDDKQLQQLQKIVTIGCPVANVLKNEQNKIETVVKVKGVEGGV